MEKMSEEEVLSLNNYLEDLYQAMQIGDIVFESKRSSELYNLINKLLKENQELKNQQKEFIEYLEEMLDSEIGVFAEVKVCDVLSKYKEIIGGKE